MTPESDRALPRGEKYSLNKILEDFNAMGYNQSLFEQMGIQYDDLLCFWL